MNKAVESHAGLKAQWAQQQKDKIDLVAEWRGMGLGKDGKPKKPRDRAKGRAAVKALIREGSNESVSQRQSVHQSFSQWQSYSQP